MTRDTSELLSDTILRMEGLYKDRERLTARVAELEAALSQCADWFKQYGDGHKAKGDTDKAGRNYNREAFARAALTRPAHEPPTELGVPTNAKE